MICGASILITTALRLNHFGAMLLFALLVSLVLACLTQRSSSGGVKYALWSFALFVLVGVGVAWLMYPISR
ncbi:MAG: hypothetical protein ABSC10_02200 [Candidatus Acidiferrales bacterium]